MKSISKCIFEASGKPSDIKKYKQTARKETVHFKSGDIYDLSDPGYDDEFTYYDGSGNGYIKDKQGHVYDVVTSESTGDAGRIAGGSQNYYVCIKKANGKDDFVVTGYSAIFSKGSNTSCVSDIKAGYYLEDYIAKYYNKYDHGEKFADIAAKGNKNAKSYNGEQAEKKAQKAADFDSRYMRLPQNIPFEIANNGFQIIYWNPGKSDEVDAKRNERNKVETWIKDENGKDIKNPEWNKLNDEIHELQKKADDLLTEKLKVILINKLSKVFKTKDIDSLKGISGSFVVPNDYRKIGKNGDKWSHVTLAIDTKTKNIVTIASEMHKLIDSNITLKLADNITINKKFMSKKMETLFRTVAKAWKKANTGQAQYVEDNWYRIQKESGGYWSWNKNKSQAKREAAEEYKKLIKSMDFDKNDVLTFSLSLVQEYIQGDMEPDAESIENPLENPEPKKERGKDTKMTSTAKKAAYDKMKAWHEGTRKQNLSNCSDAKLKMNYNVCKELGYTNEADLIQQEATKRGLTLESIKVSIKDYITD